MSDKEERSPNLAGYAAILTAIAALITAIGFPSFFPDLVKHRFIHPSETVSSTPKDTQALGSGAQSSPQILTSSTPVSPQTAIEIQPDQFIQNYYTNINENKIDRAWEMLTPQFQMQSSSSYSEFYNWWNSVDQVQVQNISLITQSSQTAIVEVQTSYIINGDFKEERPQRFTLTWNANIGNWQISNREKL